MRKIHTIPKEKTENGRTVVVHGSKTYGQEDLYVIHIFYVT
jgi:hypothetical protein